MYQERFPDPDGLPSRKKVANALTHLKNHEGIFNHKGGKKNSNSPPAP